MKTAIGYIRVSSKEQADSGLGLAAQRTRIEGYCLSKDLPLVQVFEDAGVSGGKPLGSRPAGAAMLSAAKRDVVVVVAKFDRLFRSVANAAVTIDAFAKDGIELVSLAEGFDMTSLYGRAMAQLASVFAELERGMIRERTLDALAVKRSRGERISRHAPFGSGFSQGSVVHIPHEQEHADMILLLRDQGKSLRQVAAHLNSLGVPTRLGRPWIHTTVKGILERLSRERSARLKATGSTPTS